MAKNTPGRAVGGRQCSRRSFLRRGSLGAVLAAAAPAASMRTVFAGGNDPGPEADDAPPAPAGRPSPEGVDPNSFELLEATIGDLQEGMRTGRHTVRGLVELYAARIAALDREGPRLNQILEMNPDALKVADELDAERRAGKTRGPLHGIPVLLKDNVGTADRMTTAGGSLALVGSSPQKDSFVARKLREAGAVLLGKTNLSEWANFRSTRSSSGWSGRGGQGLNPYALDRSPCGSSAGSGAAIAANFAAVSIGTETDGSIVCPSAANSLVGIKPTVGLVSRAGIIPLSHNQDTAGPMGRTVTDAAILLGAIAGRDPDDNVTRSSRGGREDDYTKFLDPHGLRGARIGVAREHFFGYSAPTDRIIEEALAEMKRAGAVLVDPADIPHVGEYDDSEFEVLLSDFKADIEAYLAGLGPLAPARSLEQLITFNERHRDSELRYFGQEIFTMAVEKGPLTRTEYRDALDKNHRLSRREGIDAVMKDHKLDALVAPTGGPPWTIDLVNGDHFSGGSSSPAAVSGYASITVPAGYIFGLPVGLSFIGGAFSEATLIRLAYAFEQATHVRRPPRFLPTADLLG